ncbi:MAG: hypothetical protein IPM57_08385 [Oligoflexia bacterium]|nr:hypothetical protein [Oligoflexia bacterium]
MNLVPINIDLSLNFFPQNLWPMSLPLVCGADSKLVLGFERFLGLDGSQKQMALVLDQKAHELLPQLYDVNQMSGFEFLRFNKVLNNESDSSTLLAWPLELQLYCDQKKLGLKNIKPLTYVSQFMPQISEALLSLTPTSSQLREVIELLCDLNFQNKYTWFDLKPKSNIDEWLKDLNQKRFPITKNADTEAKKELSQVSWPKGVNAKWENKGDQASLIIQSRVFSNIQWKKLRDELAKIDLSENTWKI